MKVQNPTLSFAKKRFHWLYDHFTSNQHLGLI